MATRIAAADPNAVQEVLAPIASAETRRTVARRKPNRRWRFVDGAGIPTQMTARESAKPRE
jgi:hypothetical protein